MKKAIAYNKSCDIKLTKHRLEQQGGLILPLLAASTPIAARALAGTAIAFGAKALIDKIRRKGIRRTKLKGRGYLMPWQTKK